MHHTASWWYQASPLCGGWGQGPGRTQRADFILSPLPAAPASHQLHPYGCWGKSFLRRAQTNPSSMLRSSVAVGLGVHVPSRWLCWCPSQSGHKGMQPRGDLGGRIDKHMSVLGGAVSNLQTRIPRLEQTLTASKMSAPAWS